MLALVAVSLVVAAGLLPAYALTRNLLLAALVAPLVSALVSAVAVIVMFVLGGSLPLWDGVLVLALNAAVPLLLRHRWQAPLPHGSRVDVVWYVLPLLPPLLLIVKPPVLWDAHAIWWLHAGYFTRGAGFARAATGSPAFAVSHPDYPPLAPSVVAAVWSLLGSYSFRVAQAVSSLVTFSAIATLSFAVRSVTGRGLGVVSRSAGVGVSLGAWATARATITGGYTDPLWATAFVAAAVLLLFGEEPLARPALPLVLLAVAALTKNEGLVCVVALAVLVTLRGLGDLRRVWRVWLPVAAGLAWSATARHFGARSDVLNGRLGELLAGDPAVLGRVPPTLAALQSRVGAVVACSLGAAVLGALFLRYRRRELGLGSDLWLWAMNAAFVASLIVTYITSSNPIYWYLWTSASRVTLPIALMATASAACWAVTAFGARPVRSPP